MLFSRRTESLGVPLPVYTIGIDTLRIYWSATVCPFFCFNFLFLTAFINVESKKGKEEKSRRKEGGVCLLLTTLSLQSP